MAHETSLPSNPHTGRVGRVLVALGAVLSLFVAAGAGAGIAIYLRANGTIKTGSSTLGSNGQVAVDKVTGSRVADQCQTSGCNFLLLGSDSRTGLSKSQQTAFGTNKDIGGAQRFETI